MGEKARDEREAKMKDVVYVVFQPSGKQSGGKFASEQEAKDHMTRLCEGVTYEDLVLRKWKIKKYDLKKARDDMDEIQNLHDWILFHLLFLFCAKKQIY